MSAVIKQNGVEREKICFDNELQELLKFLYPTKTKTNISLLEPGNRNNELLSI